MLAGTLKAIISQRLVPRADGSGRIAIAEVIDISMEDARHYASRPHDFALLVAASKQTVTASRSPTPEPSRAS